MVTEAMAPVRAKLPLFRMVEIAQFNMLFYGGWLLNCGRRGYSLVEDSLSRVRDKRFAKLAPDPYCEGVYYSDPIDRSQVVHPDLLEFFSRNH